MYKDEIEIFYTRVLNLYQDQEKIASFIGQKDLNYLKRLNSRVFCEFVGRMMTKINIDF